MSGTIVLGGIELPAQFNNGITIGDDLAITADKSGYATLKANKLEFFSFPSDGIIYHGDERIAQLANGEYSFEAGNYLWHLKLGWAGIAVVERVNALAPDLVIKIPADVVRQAAEMGVLSSLEHFQHKDALTLISYFHLGEDFLSNEKTIKAALDGIKNCLYNGDICIKEVKAIEAIVPLAKDARDEAVVAGLKSFLKRGDGDIERMPRCFKELELSVSQLEEVQIFSIADTLSRGFFPGYKHFGCGLHDVLVVEQLQQTSRNIFLPAFQQALINYYTTSGWEYAIDLKKELRKFPQFSFTDEQIDSKEVVEVALNAAKTALINGKVTNEKEITALKKLIVDFKLDKNYQAELILAAQYGRINCVVYNKIKEADIMQRDFCPSDSVEFDTAIKLAAIMNKFFIYPRFDESFKFELEYLKEKLQTVLIGHIEDAVYNIVLEALKLNRIAQR